jgi:hypothetical protein
MSEDSNGKLLVYASNFASHGERIRTVSTATEEMAKLLDLNIEVVKFKERFDQIYVYYKNGDEDPVPIFNDKGEKAENHKIRAALRNMMFVLSFHPKYSVLRRMRSEIMRFS